jgi:hypothetical protein
MARTNKLFKACTHKICKIPGDTIILFSKLPLTKIGYKISVFAAVYWQIESTKSCKMLTFLMLKVHLQMLQKLLRQ